MRKPVGVMAGRNHGGPVTASESLALRSRHLCKQGSRVLTVKFYFHRLPRSSIYNFPPRSNRDTVVTSAALSSTPLREG